MNLLVIGAGMMGSAAAYDMAQAPDVERVTLADANDRRAANVARRMNQLTRGKKIHPLKIDVTQLRAVGRLMREHDGALSCVPYFLNLGLARTAIAAGCHFADLGGNHAVVRQELALSRQAARNKVAIAPDCGLSPGMASILGGELVRRLGGKADALKIYVGGLPAKPRPPFQYQLVFSAEGLINEYVESCRILRGGKITLVPPLTEPEQFTIEGFPPLEAFHTSGGTSTLPDTFRDKVGECFEKTLRYQGHYVFLRGLRDLGLFSERKMKVNSTSVSPRRLLARLFEQHFAGKAPDVVILRVQAHGKDRVAAFTVIAHCDPKAGFTAMMRTTAWPASIVLRMLVSGAIVKGGAIYQELDIPFPHFESEMAARGVTIGFSEGLGKNQPKLRRA